MLVGERKLTFKGINNQVFCSNVCSYEMSPIIDIIFFVALVILSNPQVVLRYQILCCELCILKIHNHDLAFHAYCISPNPTFRGKKIIYTFFFCFLIKCKFSQISIGFLQLYCKPPIKKYQKTNQAHKLQYFIKHAQMFSPKAGQLVQKTMLL